MNSAALVNSCKKALKASCACEFKKFDKVVVIYNFHSHLIKSHPYKMTKSKFISLAAYYKLKTGNNLSCMFRNTPE